MRLLPPHQTLIDGNIRICGNSVLEMSPFLAIDLPLDIDAHCSASFRRRNVSLTYFPFRRTWTRQQPDFGLVTSHCGVE
jgi:hypothetical protein